MAPSSKSQGGWIERSEQEACSSELVSSQPKETKQRRSFITLANLDDSEMMLNQNAAACEFVLCCLDFVPSLVLVDCVRGYKRGERARAERVVRRGVVIQVLRV